MSQQDHPVRDDGVEGHRVSRGADAQLDGTTDDTTGHSWRWPFRDEAADDTESLDVTGESTASN